MVPINNDQMYYYHYYSYADIEYLDGSSFFWHDPTNRFLSPHDIFPISTAAMTHDEQIPEPEPDPGRDVLR